MRPDDDIPERLLSRVIEVWRPEEIRLFGSRARGTGVRPDSDWDLLVIVADETPDAHLDPVFARRALRGVGVPIDIVVCRRSDYEEGKSHFGTLAQIVEDEGRTIYGA